MTKINRTPNHSSWKFVVRREAFQGSSLRGEVYTSSGAPSAAGSWLSEYERDMYEKARPYITYVVWSFYTPIAYYSPAIEGGQGWYKVGQTFSSYTGRHASGALRNVPGHIVILTGSRGDWTVTCHEPECWGERRFTIKGDAERAYYNHR